MPLHEPGNEPLDISDDGEDVNVMALVKGAERYVFMFRDRNVDAVFQTLGKFATNPELSFTWYDAAVLSQKLREKKGPQA